MILHGNFEKAALDGGVGGFGCLGQSQDGKGVGRIVGGWKEAFAFIIITRTALAIMRVNESVLLWKNKGGIIWMWAMMDHMLSDGGD